MHQIEQESPIAPVKVPVGYLNIMGYIHESKGNGPGSRAVVWVQGCNLKCSGCYNSASWSFAINQLISVDELAEIIVSNFHNQGVTFSGGEPFLQAPALASLARKVRAEGLNVMCLTGFTLEYLQSDFAPLGSQELLQELDILIDGKYVPSLAVNVPDSPISSSNQKIYIFNPNFKNKITWNSDRLEAHLMKDGSSVFSGYRGWLQELVI
jgi:anaerobic ribonucleoside-triphosphate reductase activating protein